MNQEIKLYECSSHQRLWTIEREKRNLVSQQWTEEEVEYIQATHVDLLFEIGRRMQLHPIVCRVASVYYHRYYHGKQLFDKDPLLVGPTCFYAACKFYEVLVHIETIVSMMNVLYVNYNYSVEDIEVLEVELLTDMKFSLLVYLPENHIDILTHSIPGFDYALQDMTISLCDYSYRKDICLYYSPLELAYGCILLTCLEKAPHLLEWIGQQDIPLEPLRYVVKDLIDIVHLTIDEHLDKQRGIIEKLRALFQGTHS